MDCFIRKTGPGIYGVFARELNYWNNYVCVKPRLSLSEAKKIKDIFNKFGTWKNTPNRFRYKLKGRGIG